MDRITSIPIDLQALIDEVGDPRAGAILTFSGVVREENAGRAVRAIEYHGYRPMAEREILAIEREIVERWQGVRAVIVHRLGHLGVGDASVCIAVSSPHRGEGFAALRYAIDTLKARVPIWKKEIHPDGESWLEGS